MLICIIDNLVNYMIYIMKQIMLILLPPTNQNFDEYGAVLPQEAAKLDDFQDFCLT